MGLLDQWKGKKLEATPLLGGATQALGLLGDAGTMAIRELDKRNKAMARPFTDTSPEAQKQAVAAAMDFVGMAPIGMTAWHGSPHKFDKFSLDKIGTGEGAQAYGHGLYLAESPAVATEYRNKLSTGYTGGDGSLTHYGDAYQTAYDAAQSAGATRPDHARAIASQVQEWVDSGKKASTFMRYNSVPKELEPAYKAATDAWKTFKPNEGALYKTDIPDEAVARFLDWDKPLSQQAPEVQAVLQNQKMQETIAALKSRGELGNYSPDELAQLRGEDYYDMLRQANGDSNIAPYDFLKSQGIQGIRYLDGGSRNQSLKMIPASESVNGKWVVKDGYASKGNYFDTEDAAKAFYNAELAKQTSNFVVFDPEMIRILERNGQATGLSPWKPGEYGLLKP